MYNLYILSRLTCRWPPLPTKKHHRRGCILYLDNRVFPIRDNVPPHQPAAYLERVRRARYSNSSRPLSIITRVSRARPSEMTGGTRGAETARTSPASAKSKPPRIIYSCTRAAYAARAKLSRRDYVLAGWTACIIQIRLNLRVNEAREVISPITDNGAGMRFARRAMRSAPRRR